MPDFLNHFWALFGTKILPNSGDFGRPKNQAQQEERGGS
jgi:hypothetical protein